MSNDQQASASSGDWVSAQLDTRDATTIEGILYLRYVPALAYVQVRVDGHNVDPHSVIILRPGAISIESLEEGDPVVSDPAWRRIPDLDTARSERLLTDSEVREGGTWEDMFGRLDELVAPLIAASWQVQRSIQETEASWEYGESVIYVLARRNALAEVEMFDDTGVHLWDAGESADPDEPDPPLLSFDAATPAGCRAGFHHIGWLP